MHKSTYDFVKNQLDIIQKIRKEPFKYPSEILTIQENLIRKISKTEKSISKNNNEIKFFNKELKVKRDVPLIKSEANTIKLKIENLYDKKNILQNVNYILHHIADSIAFLLIDRWDIKPLSFKDSPGFISGKKGSLLERKCFRIVFKKGGIAILNDLTNCLRYGDITILSLNKPLLIVECKSGEKMNSRGYRQQEELINIINYLDNDTTELLYGKSETVKRIQVRQEIFYHTSKLNQILATHSTEFAISLLENGLYLISGGHIDFELLSSVDLGTKPIFEFLNKFQYSNIGYYPFSLLFDNPVDFMNFYTGNLTIGVITIVR
jgi:hypothetical protein